MSHTEQYHLQEKIADIINRSRAGQEMFFIDFDMAAKNILAYLESENIIRTEKAIEIKYSEQSKAA